VNLVLLPGMDGTGILFEPFIAAARVAKLSVTVVSYPTDVPLNYVELTEIARAALPPEGPFVILGESYSGPIAIELAKSCSPRLNGLVLCCTFARNPRPALRLLQPFFPLLPGGSVSPTALNYFLFGRFSTPTLEALAVRAVEQVAPDVRRGRLRQLLTLDVSNTLAALTLPILYLRASEDRVIPRRESDYICRLNPRVRVVGIEAPHMLLQASSAEAARVIGDFIDDAGHQG
jgi:pimeloyl-ACP methyl ester carboxylesterase